MIDKIAEYEKEARLKFSPQIDPTTTKREFQNIPPETLKTLFDAIALVSEKNFHCFSFVLDLLEQVSDQFAPPSSAEQISEQLKGFIDLTKKRLSYVNEKRYENWTPEGGC